MLDLQLLAKEENMKYMKPRRTCLINKAISSTSLILNASLLVASLEGILVELPEIAEGFVDHRICDTD